MNDKGLKPSTPSAARETAREIFARIQRRRGLPETLPTGETDTGGASYTASGSRTRAGTAQHTGASRTDSQAGAPTGARQPFARHAGSQQDATSRTASSFTSQGAGRRSGHEAGPDESDLADLRAAMARLHEATQAADGRDSGERAQARRQEPGKSDGTASSGGDRTRETSPLDMTEPPEPVDIIHHPAFSSQRRLTQSLLVDEDGTPIDEERLHAERQAHDGQAEGEAVPDTFPRSHTIRTLLRYPTATTAVGVALAIPVATMLLRNHATRKALVKTGKFLASEEIWKTLKKISKV